MKFEDVISLIGEFGKFQRKVYLLLALATVSGCIQLLISVFTMAVPDHRCAIPGYDNDTWDVQNDHHAHLINISIPPGVSSPYSSCEVYTDISRDFILSTYFHESNSDSQTNGSSSPRNGSSPGDEQPYDVADSGPGSIHSGDRTTRKCDSYVYDTSVFKTSVVTQMDLVCDRKMGRSHAQTATMVGYLTGSAISSVPSDMFGRKRVMMVAVVLHVITALSLAWIPYLPLLCVMCWLNGTSVMGLYTNGYVICMELVGPSKRASVGISIVIFWALGMVVLTPLAYWLRYWKTLQMAVTILPIFFLSYYWLVPESPRWLLKKGRVEEAESIIRQAARYNGREDKLPEVLLDKNMEEESKGESVLMLRRHPRLLLKYIFVVYCWFVSSFTFYGLNLNIGSLSGSVYLNFLLSGLVEIVSYVMCILLLKKVGRRTLNSSLMLLAGISCTATVIPVYFAPPSLQWITVALALLGKLGVAGAFAIIWMWTSELYPTVIRNSGTGTSSVCAGMGAILAPYIANTTHALGGAALAVPLVAFGVASIIAGLLMVLLPETLNRRLPETIDDALYLFRIKTPASEDETQCDVNRDTHAKDAPLPGEMELTAV